MLNYSTTSTWHCHLILFKPKLVPLLYQVSWLGEIGLQDYLTFQTLWLNLLILELLSLGSIPRFKPGSLNYAKGC